MSFAISRQEERDRLSEEGITSICPPIARTIDVPQLSILARLAEEASVRTDSVHGTLQYSPPLWMEIWNDRRRGTAAIPDTAKQENRRPGPAWRQLCNDYKVYARHVTPRAGTTPGGPKRLMPTPGGDVTQG